MPPVTLSPESVVRTLQLYLFALRPSVPYRAARLGRITDQLEYVILEWPAFQWPSSNRQGASVPAQATLLAQVMKLKADFFSARPLSEGECDHLKQKLMALTHLLA